MKVIVTGGAFDERGDGLVWLADFAAERADVLVRWKPPEQLRVAAKGFAGGSLGDDGLLYVAAHAAVVRIDPRCAEVTGLLHQPCMNDLHHVAVVGGHLYVANTGLGAVDVFTVSGEFMGSHSLLPAWANSKRMHGERAPEPLTRAHLAWSGTPPTSWPESADRGDGYFTSSREPQAFHQRKVPDHLHVNHVVSLDGRLLATCFADGSLRDLRTFEVAASVGRPFVHDGVVHGSSLWLTSVDGTVFELDRRTLGARRTLDACGSRHRGWCRGLAVTSEHLMVGLTESRRGGSLQQPWAQVETSGTETSVLLLDKAGGRLLARVEIKDRDRHTKLYSVLPTT